MSDWRTRLADRARGLRDDTLALGYAYLDRRTPWYAKAWALLVLAYAVSPIDLIPDFIPVLGYLDDLFLVPMGIVLAVRMIPAGVMADARSRAREGDGLPTRWRWLGGLIVVTLWLAAVALVIWLVRLAVVAD